jgi:putative phosphoesterase
MKTLCICSDSHGNKNNIKKVISQIQKIDIAFILHLGDDYDDANLFVDSGYQVLRVPGIYGEKYQNPKIENRIFFPCEGWRLFLTHNQKSHENDLPTDIHPETVINEKKADIFLYGHTHEPEIKKEKGIIFINPGHIKSNLDRGHAPTYIILECNESKIRIKLIDLLTENVIEEKNFRK